VGLEASTSLVRVSTNLGLDMNDTHQVLAYANGVNLIDHVRIIERNAYVLLIGLFSRESRLIWVLRFPRFHSTKILVFKSSPSLFSCRLISWLPKQTFRRAQLLKSCISELMWLSSNLGTQVPLLEYVI
jgi:hypothetical protein